jgi:hypothetical protein
MFNIGTVNVQISREDRAMERVYRKVGKRYVEIGMEWVGFPADGIWLVSNGRQSNTCLIGLKESVPVFALNYRKHVNELCSLIQAAHKGKPMSLYDEMILVCDFFAEKVAKGE